jgi:hypothetical protein
MVLTNPAPRGGTTSLTFDVVYAPPTLEPLADDEIVHGESELVTVTGTTEFSLYPTSTVTVDGDPITPVVFTAGVAPTLEFTIPDTFTNSVGISLPIVVTNPSPGGGSSTPQNITVIHTVPDFEPVTGEDLIIPFDGTLAVTLTGTNSFAFYPTSQVFVNDTTEITPVTYLPGTDPDYIPTLDFTIPDSVADVPGATVPLKVTNPSPGGGDSSVVNFEVANPQPTFTYTVDGVNRSYLYVGEEVEIVLTGTTEYSFVSGSRSRSAVQHYHQASSSMTRARSRP